jgi:hypothetical protein
MKCDSRASFLIHTFASPCLGHEPKARVATINHLKLEKIISRDLLKFSSFFIP